MVTAPAEKAGLALVGVITLGTGRTTVLQGIVHLVIFAVSFVLRCGVVELGRPRTPCVVATICSSPPAGRAPINKLPTAVRPWPLPARASSCILATHFRKMTAQVFFFLA